MQKISPYNISLTPEEEQELNSRAAKYLIPTTLILKVNCGVRCGRPAGQSKKAYLEFMENGIAQGRSKDLTGGGLIRSVGGWAKVKELKRQGHENVMSDERILDDSEFVNSLI